MSINTAGISGNLARDAELRETANGMAVLNFCVAVNDRRKNPQSGEWEDYPNFIECTLFGNRASGVAPYLLKGTHVSVSGKLRQDRWEKDGKKHSKIVIVVDEVDFTGSKRQEQAYEQPAPAQPEQTSVFDDDIPF